MFFFTSPWLRVSRGPGRPRSPTRRCGAYTGCAMSLRIAIPEPTSTDTDYNQRALPPYLAALHGAGATPVVVPLHERPDRIAKLLSNTQGILLPGSGFDVDPHRYGQLPIPACGPADAPRTTVDEILLVDAFSLHKPVLAICHGAQTLNIWRNGTLVQDLETVLQTPVNHRPGRDVVEAHPITITPGSHLAAIVSSIPTSHSPKRNPPGTELVNSSHHQAVAQVGNNLRIAAVSPADNVIEAIELDAPDHWVIAVQWHPERTCTVSALSRALFAALAHAADAWQPRRVEESIAR